MAKKKVEEKLPEPTFEKQLEKYSEDNQNGDDPIFSHAYQKFIVNLLKTRDKAIISEVIEFVADNESFAEKVAKKVRNDVAESYVQLERVLNEIQQGQLLISKNIVEINNRLSIAEEKVGIEEVRIENHEKRLVDKRRRIERLEIGMQMLQPEAIKLYSDEIHKVKPVLDKIVKMFSWWRIAIYVLIVAILAALMVLILHKEGYLTIFSRDKQVKNEWVDYVHNMDINNLKVRGNYIAYPTKAMADSIEKVELEKLTKEIDKLIK